MLLGDLGIRRGDQSGCEEVEDIKPRISRYVRDVPDGSIDVGFGRYPREKKQRDRHPTAV